LVLVARRATELENLAANLATETGVECRIVAADLANPDGLAAVLRAGEEREIGLLVAAAGFGTSGPFLASDARVEAEMLAVNCHAVQALSHHFGRRLAARGRGGIILFGSLVGYQGTPQAAHYAATKAYVQTLAEGLHVELAPRGVDVLSAAPGPVHTGFADRARMKMGLADRPAVVAAAIVAALGRRMTVTPGPVGKLLTWSLRTAPRSLRVRIMGQIMGKMAAH
jgi:short-subunit dehydrogenase